MPKGKKIKTLSIISTTCCEGCQFAILDLGERMVELFNDFDVREFHLVQDDKEAKQLDVVLVEGTPITKENFKNLKEARKRAKTLIALGTCAHLGGVQRLKNYGDKQKHIKYVYKNIKRIDNPDIKPLSAFVEVDFVIPGCPINNEEFMKVMKSIRDDEIPHIPDRTVCWECQLKGKECLLQKGESCYGPVILGGCDAICPSEGFPCYACRGPVSETNVESLREIFRKNGKAKEFDILLQEFGAADKVLKKEKKK